MQARIIAKSETVGGRCETAASPNNKNNENKASGGHQFNNDLTLVANDIKSL